MKKRALISVYEKEGIVDFAKKLEALGYEIVSTGGTYKLLKENNLKVIKVSDVTKFEEILDGRVKTLHPLIHGGILFRRDNKEDLKVINEKNIVPIDVVVCNLYPFEKVLKEEMKNPSEGEFIPQNLIENIDIGGPSMLRAASKNFKDVLVITDVNDYQKAVKYLEIVNENRENVDNLDEKLKKEGVYNFNLLCAFKTFTLTSYYDSVISNYFKDKLNIDFPEKLTIPLKLKEKLRYGENPHQEANYYEKAYMKKFEKLNLVKLHGKELSYNNLCDIKNAVSFIKNFNEPCVIGLKHTTPSGIGVGANIDEAFNKAFKGDPISIFGGIFILNRQCTNKIAKKINSMFMEIVIAPKFTKDSLEILKEKKNIRLIEIENLNDENYTCGLSFKETVNGMLASKTDAILFNDDEKLKTILEKIDFKNNEFTNKELEMFKGIFDFPTVKKPSKKDLMELIFAFKAVKVVSSNGIVVTSDFGTLGIGQGEVRRSFAVEEAIFRAKETIYRENDNSIEDVDSKEYKHAVYKTKLENAYLGSDSFFFIDTAKMVYENNIKAVITNGGSIRDKEVIEYFNEKNIPLVFTNIRHFRH